MDNSEQHRMELLQQAKRMRTTDTIPLVRMDRRCYNSESVGLEEEANNGSFIMRIAIAILGVVCFIWFDTANVSCFSINSQTLIRQIENDSSGSLKMIEHLIE